MLFYGWVGCVRVLCACPTTCGRLILYASACGVLARPVIVAQRCEHRREPHWQYRMICVLNAWHCLWLVPGGMIKGEINVSNGTLVHQEKASLTSSSSSIMCLMRPPVSGGSPSRPFPALFLRLALYPSAPQSSCLRVSLLLFFSSCPLFYSCSPFVPLSPLPISLRESVCPPLPAVAAIQPPSSKKPRPKLPRLFLFHVCFFWQNNFAVEVSLQIHSMQYGQGGQLTKKPKEILRTYWFRAPSTWPTQPQHVVHRRAPPSVLCARPVPACGCYSRGRCDTQARARRVKKLP